MTHHILVPLDGSDTAARALSHAGALAHLFGARVTLVRVPENMIVPAMSGSIWVTESVESDAAAVAARAYLAEARGRPELAGLDVTTLAPSGPVASTLLRAIETSGADLVVLTTHGYSGFNRFVFGSVADKIVHGTRAPIYLVRENRDTPPVPRFSRVLVPMDGSALGESALPTAVALAHVAGADLFLVQVPTVPSYVTSIPETAGWIPQFLGEQSEAAAAYLLEQSERLRQDGVSCSIDVEVVTAGSVADGLLSAAREHAADVIVMSTHGRSGLGRWLFGSVADRVLRAAELPVWLVRPSGGRSEAPSHA